MARGRNGGRFSGTRQGNQCKLFDEPDQAPYIATCDGSAFRGEAKSPPSARTSWRTQFTASATDTVDYVVRDRQRAEDADKRAAQQRQRQADADRAAEQERKRIAAMPAAGAAATRTVETAIRSDSQSWMGATSNFGNRYDVGTVRNVRVASGTASNGMLRAEYSYNGGTTGWVEAKIEGGRVICLKYWDTRSCAPVRGATARASASRGAIARAARSEGYTETLDVNNFKWVGLSQIIAVNYDRHYFAASEIKRSGSVVTARILFFSSSEASIFIYSKNRVDCRTMTMTVIQDGFYSEGSITYVKDVDAPPQTLAPRTSIGAAMETLCSGQPLRPLPDVLEAGFRAVQ